jgi:hypothetical protein
MDGDPAVEPEIDGFSRVLPLPYRVALIIVLGTQAFMLPALNCFTNSKPHRHMGMGPKSPLPHSHKDRRPKSNPLPGPYLAPPYTAPPLLLPYRNLPLHPARAFAVPVLDSYTWQPCRHCRLGNPSKSIPPSTGRWIRSATTICQS